MLKVLLCANFWYRCGGVVILVCCQDGDLHTGGGWELWTKRDNVVHHEIQAIIWIGELRINTSQTSQIKTWHLPTICWTKANLSHTLKIQTTTRTQGAEASFQTQEKVSRRTKDNRFSYLSVSCTLLSSYAHYNINESLFFRNWIKWIKRGRRVN